jgi:hypothetical protein
MSYGLHKVKGGINKSIKDCVGRNCEMRNCESVACFGVQTWTGIYKPACFLHGKEAVRRGYHVEALDGKP